MTQQINLLRAKPHPAAGTVPYGAALLAGLVALVAYGYSSTKELAQLRETAAASDARLARVQNALVKAPKPQDTAAEKAALEAELAHLRPRAGVARELVTSVQNGTLGSPRGYANHFAALANVSREGVWLTSVAISRGGSEVAIAGKAIGAEPVIGYTAQLNQSFRPLGVHFNSVEMAPASGANTTGVSFKLF